MGELFSRGSLAESDSDQRYLQQQSRSPPRPVRPAERPMSTSILLDILSKQFAEWNEVIENMKKDNMFDGGGRAYLHTLMTETEGKLHKINQDYARYQMHRSYPDQQGNPQCYQQHYNKGHSTPQDKTESGSEKDEIKRLRQIIDKRNEEIEQKKTLIKQTETECSKKMEYWQRLCSKYERQCKEFQENWAKENCEAQEKLLKLQKEKQAVLDRLSRIASEQLTKDNPHIVDLSDPNRPTKLGEMYRELYDNQWTDAFDALVDEERTERQATDILRDTLMDVVDFCAQKADKQVKLFRQMVNDFSEACELQTESKDSGGVDKRRCATLAIPQGAQKPSKGHIMDRNILLYAKWQRKNQDGKEGEPEVFQTMVKPDLSFKGQKFRKEVATSLLPGLQKTYLISRWDRGCIPELKPFIKECIRIGWFMVVQSPPMALRDIDPPGRPFNKDTYNAYTKSGDQIDYVIWPALLLTRDGKNLVAKGVAQGK